MTVRDYYPEDYHMISKWCSLRDQSILPAWAFPSTGVIVPYVACGFLICMNNEMAMMDMFVSNPEADKEKRKKAFELIVEELELSAKEAGIKKLLASTNVKATQDMARKHNYEYDGSFMHFSKEL